ncbi:hypothetical protein BDV96DRAFT_686788 [Lophiotrema nucula]|uniref:Translation initiation factor eIF-2B subunit family protein n=1 Tax=Lophiotrema nucula TaxID=690887 RepID=A0A6A5ZDJ5_9PLEO|nr:hypothetical protein BDV96DRAFT_686788 [Lophiotrema nucula]
MNGDGQADYCVVNIQSGRVDVWYNQGPVSKSWGSQTPAGMLWWNSTTQKNAPVASGVTYLEKWTAGDMVTFGDLNGDGRDEYLYVGKVDSNYTSGARQLASTALSSLSQLLGYAALTCQNRVELWDETRRIAKELVAARPSMSAAINSCLIRALSSIDETWRNHQKEEKERGEGVKEVGVKGLVDLAQARIDQIMRERKEVTSKLGAVFMDYITSFQEPRSQADTNSPLHILTLSNSSTIRTALLTLSQTHPSIPLEITVMESRPRCEGADMCAQILRFLDSKAKEKWRFKITPDCAIGTAAKDTDILLLGADRISSEGRVSNKIGSAAAAICVRHCHQQHQQQHQHQSDSHSKGKVVILSESDKIVAEGVEDRKTENHPAEEMSKAWSEETRKVLEDAGVEVFGEWFEWVGWESVDVYVTERGVLDREGVKRVAEEIEGLERRVFGGGTGWYDLGE